MKYQYRLMRSHPEFTDEFYKEGRFIANASLAELFSDSARAFDIADDEFEKNASWTYSVERI